MGFRGERGNNICRDTLGRRKKLFRGVVGRGKPSSFLISGRAALYWSATRMNGLFLKKKQLCWWRCFKGRIRRGPDGWKLGNLEGRKFPRGVVQGWMGDK